MGRVDERGVRGGDGRGVYDIDEIGLQGEGNGGEGR